MDIARLILDRVPTRHRLAVVLAAGAAVRLVPLLLVPELCDALERRPEVMSPLTSFRSLKEGVWIYDRGMNPYQGGVFYHSPLYLALFSYIVPASSKLLTSAAWIVADLAGSLALVSVYTARASREEMKMEERKAVQGAASASVAAAAVSASAVFTQEEVAKEVDGDAKAVTKSKISIEDRSALIALLYLFNPYTLLTCLSRSTSTIDSTLLLLSIANTASFNPLLAGAFLALASHTAVYPTLLLPPLLLACAPRTGATAARIQLVIAFVVVAAAGAVVGWSLVGTEWIQRTWGVVLTVSDLTPNVGMWWYFFAEMFDHFRNFFLGVFQLHTVIYVAPLCLRLRHDPLVAVLVLVGVLATWKSYPTLGDMAAWAGLLSCFPEIVSNLRHPLFTLAVHLYTSILLPLLHSLWLLSGTGNANFFYAATMVYGLNASLAVADALGAALTVDTRRRVNDEVFGVQDVDDDVLKEEWKSRGWSVTQLPDL